GAALLIFLTGVFIKKGRDISLFYQGRYSCAFFKNPDCGLIVLNAGIAGDKLTGAVLESGYSEIEILLLSAVSENYIRGLKELSENIKIKKILIPFGYRSKSALKLFKDLKERGVEIQEMWPGEEKKICSFKIGPQWGLHFYPDGKFFRNTGYCGDSYFDRLSWHFQSAGFDFEFTRFGNGVRLYKSKKTIGQLGNKGIGDIKARKGKIIKIDI
ncbi:MAG: hypothetical protein U9Q34_02310, partial [Elusimicrobiota bacterium]|nr:hypothetical protein [Elusimicrobiota bacterium]